MVFPEVLSGVQDEEHSAGFGKGERVNAVLRWVRTSRNAHDEELLLRVAEDESYPGLRSSYSSENGVYEGPTFSR